MVERSKDMNIFFREMKANRKALIIWSISMFILVVSGMSKYTAYTAGGQTNELLNKLPHSIKALLGFGSFDVTTISGFFAMLFLYLEIAVSIHASLLGSGIIAKEESDKTTEFLMTKPVSRTFIITSKLFAALVNIIVINIVATVSSIVIVSAYNKGADISSEIIVFMVSMFIVQLIFLSIGSAVASFMKNSKASGSISAVVVVAALVISRITDLTDKLDLLNIFSPFKYFSYADMAAGKSLNLTIVMLSLLLIAALTALTYVFYRSRDLSV